jgi:hypothetical protein
VAEADYSRRIDAHMERWQRADGANRRPGAARGRTDGPNRRAFEDLRTFLYGMTVRRERVLGRMADHLADLTQAQRAQRSALLRMLDRPDDGGPAACA